MVMASYDIIDDRTIRITELPHGVRLMDYLKFLETLVKSNKFIESYCEKCTCDQIDIKITLIQKIDSYMSKNLKLFVKINLSNMHLMDSHGSIKKYNSYGEILTEFYNYRLEIYEKQFDSLNKSAKKIWLNDLNKFKTAWKTINA